MKKLTQSIYTAALAIPACIALSSCSSQPKAPEAEHYLFIAIGQSNMVGKGIPEAQDTVPCPRFLNLASTNNPDRKIGEWRLAVPGNCRPSDDYPNYVSPTDYFGRTLCAYLPEHVNVGVLQVGVDGCPIRLFDRNHAFVDSTQVDWMENQINAWDRRPYDRIVTLAKQAQEEGWQIKGLLIHQGETDAYSLAWANEIDTIYHQLLEDLNLVSDSVPVLCGETVGSDQNGVCQHANPTIDRIHEDLPYAYAIPSLGCKVSEDFVHFATEGYRLLGRRYALKWLQLKGYDVDKTFDCDGQQIALSSLDAPLQCERGNAEDAFQLQAFVRKNNGHICLSADVALASIDVVSFNGATLATIDTNGQQEIDIDATEWWKGEDRLMLNVHDAEGRTVNRMVK